MNKNIKYWFACKCENGQTHVIGPHDTKSEANEDRNNKIKGFPLGCSQSFKAKDRKDAEKQAEHYC